MAASLESSNHVNLIEKKHKLPLVEPTYYQPKAHGILESAPLIDVKGVVFKPLCVLNNGKFATAYCIQSESKQLLVARISQDVNDADNIRIAVNCLNESNGPFLCLPFLTQCIMTDVVNFKRYFLHISAFCSGGDLLDLYADMYENGQSFSEAQIFPWICQITEAITFIHQHHVFHCDIKLSNLLIDSAGCLRLTDFGCARYGIADGTIYLCPTWVHPEIHMGHMPPESFASDEPCFYNNTLDWYQLGACIYTLLEQKRPLSHFQGFEATSELSQRLRIETVQPSRSDISSALCSFVSRLLAGNYLYRLGANGMDYIDVWRHDFLRNHVVFRYTKVDIDLMRDLVRQQSSPALQPKLRPQEYSCSRCQPRTTELTF